MGLLTALLIGSVVSALAGAGASMYGSAKNADTVRDTNNTNLELQNSANQTNLQIARENNQAAMDMAANRHQIEVEDLKKAGLNPVLSAGGQGAPMATLSTPRVDAAKMQAPLIDMSGVSNALNSMSHAMAMSIIASDRSQAIRDSASIRADGYKKMQLGSHEAAKAQVNTAKQLEKQRDKLMGDIEWNDLVNDIEGLPTSKKYKKASNRYYDFMHKKYNPFYS